MQHSVAAGARFRGCRARAEAPGSELPGEELRTPLPERPVLVAVLHDGDDQVVLAHEPRGGESFGEGGVDRLLLLLSPALLGDVDDDDAVAALEAEPGVLGDDRA